MSAQRTYWPADLPLLTVIGAGVPGKDLAVAGLRFGHTVRLTDADASGLEDAKRHVEKRLHRFEQHGQLHTRAADVLERFSAVGSLAEALDGASVVIEALPGDAAAKREALAEVGKHAGDALVVSHVNGATLADTVHGLDVGARVVGAHFFSPAAALPVTELAPGPSTDASVLDEATAAVRGLGRDVVRLRAATPGLAATRVQTRLLVACSEAAASEAPSSLDAGFRALGFPMGPFEVMDMMGLDRVAASAQAAGTEVPAALAERVAKEHFGRRSGQGWFTSEGPDREAEAADVWPVLVPALIEAARLVDEGLADAASVDRALRLAGGFPGGPFQLVRAYGADQVAKLAEEQELDPTPLTSMELPPPHEGIEVAEEAGVTLVRVAHGHDGNRITKEVAGRMRDAVDAAEGAVVVTGEGRFFLHPQLGALDESFLEPLRLKPTVAVLHGPLGDGAMSLARACRRRVARSDAAIGIERPVAAARAVELELVDAMAHPSRVAEAVADVLAGMHTVAASSVRDLLAR